jgi:uncharacterized peroxidase-related enzyme
MSHNHIGGEARETFPEFEELFKAVENSMGYLPNAYLGMAKRPELLKSFSSLIMAIFTQEGLSPGLRQLIALACSLSAGCKYCQAHTSHGAERAGINQQKIAEILKYNDSELYAENERAVLDLAFAAGETPNRSSKEHFDELKKYFSDEVITDIVSVISIFGFLNRWNDTLGTELEGMPSDFIKNDLRPLGWS